MHVGPVYRALRLAVKLDFKLSQGQYIRVTGTNIPKFQLEKALGILIVTDHQILHKEDRKGCFFILDKDWSEYTTIKGKPGHRIVYETFIGPLKQGQVICHKCDRKGCINPAHLFQGTYSDNTKDTLNKGRMHQIQLDKGCWIHISNELREKNKWKKLSRFAGE